MDRPKTICHDCKSSVFNASSFPKLFVKNDGLYEDGGMWVLKSRSTLSTICTFCQLCRLTTSPSAHTDGAKPSESVSIHIYAAVPEGLKERDASTLFVDAGSHGCTRYEIFADKDDPAAANISGRIPDPIVDSPRAFEVAKTWIRDCIETHDDCHGSTGALPTRVLDVAPDDPSAGVSLFTSNGKQASYATLSYCWGAPQPAMTTSSLLPDYTRCIDILTLSQTIQDAIKVVRGIGFRYLWVDSLCIVQDSEDDKSFEIQNMASVYRNAQVCLLAAAAKTANDGFLHRPSPLNSMLYELPYFCKDGQIGTMKLRPWSHSSERDAESDPTNRRAWIFQERVLSPRILVFPPAPHPLEWRCHSQSYSNGGSMSNVSALDISNLTSDIFGHHDRSSQELSHSARFGFNKIIHWKLWSTLLMNYTRRDLSDNADKLPAMSAVAAKFGKFWDAEYFAGLWSPQMIQSLLWKYYPDRTISSQQVVRQGPSWSWASTTKGVINVFTKDDTRIHPYHFELIECLTTPINALAPYGGVKHGLLIVKAILKPAYWTMPVRLSALLDMEDPASPIGQGFLDMARFQGSREVWCLPLVDASKYESYISSGLVLQELNNGQFQRIGVYNLSKLDWFEGCQQRRVEIV